jgi:hypothetical protein
MTDETNEKHDANEESTTTPTSHRPDVPVAGGATESWWLDQPENINRIVMALVAACIAAVASDFFYHKHADYAFQEWLGFDAVFGFVAYVGLITVAKGIRRLLMRSEDYYD